MVLLITTFMEFIWFTLQSKFYYRRETATKNTSLLALKVKEKLNVMAEKARHMNVYGMSQFEF